MFGAIEKWGVWTRDFVRWTGRYYLHEETSQWGINRANSMIRNTKTWLSCCCPESQRSWSFESAGLTPSHAPINHRWGVVDVLVGHFIILVLGPGRCRTGQPASSPLPLTTRVNSWESPWLVHLLQQWTRSRASFLTSMSSGFSLNYTFKASSTMLPRRGIGSTLLNAKGDEEQVPLTFSYDHCYDLKASCLFCLRSSSKSTALRK